MPASATRQDRAALSQALQRGDTDRVGAILRRLLKSDPRDPALHHTAAELSWRQGNRTKALKHFSAALDHARANPDAAQAAAIHASASQNIGHLLGSYAIDCQGLVSRTAFMDLLVNPAVDPQAVAGAAAPLWMKSQPWRPVFDQPPEAAARWLLSPNGSAARADGLAGALLTRAVLSDPQIEALLLAVRAALLVQDAADCDLAFLALIARQWHLRDYAGVVRAAETTVQRRLQAHPPTTLIDQYRRALYEDPAIWLPDVTAALDPWLQSLAVNRVVEAQLAAQLPVADGITPANDAVRAQYEKHPYPRWLGLTVPKGGSRQALMARATGDKAWLNRPLDVLIAGCGTGRHALMAAFGYGAKAQVLAVDISAKSLGYATRLAGAYQPGNLRFAQADLRALDALPSGTLPDGGFDVIECVGVLHHLPDTAAGLQTLTQHLKPGGMIQLGLYRRAGRQHVAQARAEIDHLGLDPTRDDDIRAFRAKVLADPQHPIFPAIAHNRDFYSLPGCRDLLFHARERDIDLKGIATLLAATGLQFQAMQMPDGVLNAFATDHGKEALSDLDAWHAFEAARPDLFDAMYRFWAIRRAG